MEITVVCPKCHNRMRSSSEHIGRSGRCPSCRALVEIQPEGGSDSLATLLPDQPPAKARGIGDTDVPAWLAALFGLGATLLLYGALFWPLRGTKFGELFVSRGMIPPLTTLLTCWGGALLVLKYRAVKNQLQYTEDELELIPLEIGMQVTAVNVNQFLQHLSRLPSNQRLSILGRRIQGALEHFKSRNSVPEVQQYLATQAEIDASQIDAGYTLLRALIWAIPILGFIGTVIGISEAVQGLDATLGSDSGGENLMGAMQLVTGGLSKAFDTTLLALSMAILLLFPTEGLRKTEYRMLDQVTSFANESVLRRMSDEQDALDPEQLPEIVRDSLEAAFREHQKWLAQWQLQVASLGQSVGGDFELCVRNISRELAEAESERQQKLDDLSRLLSKVFDQAGQVASPNGEPERQIASQLESFTQAVRDLPQRIADVIGQYQTTISAPKPDGAGTPHNGDGLVDESTQISPELPSTQSLPTDGPQVLSATDPHRDDSVTGQLPTDDDQTQQH